MLEQYQATIEHLLEELWHEQWKLVMDGASSCDGLYNNIMGHGKSQISFITQVIGL